MLTEFVVSTTLCTIVINGLSGNWIIKKKLMLDAYTHPHHFVLPLLMNIQLTIRAIVLIIFGYLLDTAHIQP